MANHAALAQLFEMRIESLALTLCLIAKTLQDRLCDRRARIDGIDVNTERSERIRQRFRQRDAGDIARRRADRRTRGAPRAAAQVDNPAPARLLHVRGRFPGTAIVAEEFFFEIL